VPEEEARTFSLDEIERLLGAVRDDYKPFTLVAMLTGARFGEIRELRWKDIDFARGWIHIRRQRPTHEGDTVRSPKWDSIRTVEMMDPVRQVLRTLPRGNADALVFPAKAGRPVHPSHFRRHVWNPALFKSGTRMKPHEMRDVFISLMIAFGEDIMRIASQTGHRNLAVFFHHYAHEFQRNGRRLSRKETYRRLMAAFRIRADPERASFLTVNQAANTLDVSWGWLLELIRKEQIPATNRGQWLIPRDALTQIRLPRSHRRDEHPQTPKKH
jgi:excisionase family DNA binding protein